MCSATSLTPIHADTITVTADAVYWHLDGDQHLTASFISAQEFSSVLTEARLLTHPMTVVTS